MMGVFLDFVAIVFGVAGVAPVKLTRRGSSSGGQSVNVQETVSLADDSSFKINNSCFINTR